MEDDALELIQNVTESTFQLEWKPALDSLFDSLRKGFVFDNLAIYVTEKGSLPEVIYACSIGRGRKQEADVSWGEDIASQVLTAMQVVQVIPEYSSVKERVRMPYLLGIPFRMVQGDGALVFIRFGGPQYLVEQVRLTNIIANLVGWLLDHRALREHIHQLYIARQRAQLQDDFIATISHEINTPLGFIKGYTTSLLRSDTTWDPETQQEFLTIIDEETDHLMSLIEHILDSARLKSGAMYMEFQPLRLDSLIRDMTERMRTRKESGEIVLDLEPVPPVQADTLRLTQVLENLFENTRKYAPGAKVTISLGKSSKTATLVFADNGPGIPPEHLPFLFERFYRVPGQVGKRGAGLGLFICREIIRAHNGHISVETAPEKGTAFRIDLPFAKR
ncbi:MAG: HAMP domain-containing histidine kinase [Chloroflexi bacterium]|nr:HAMP domain-containing histidine kinase [Chloroflexota bacterium]